MKKVKKKALVSNKAKKIVLAALGFIFTAFIGAVLSHFVWPGFMNTIDEKLLGKPDIIVNVNEIHPLENEQHLENFALMFGTASGQGTVLAAQIGQPELNKIFGDVIIPIDFGRNDNKLEYSILILNSGDRTARDVKVTFSGDMLKTDYKLDVDERIDFVSCGGANCDIRIKQLAPDEKVGMFVKARTPSVANVNISAKGNYDSFVNFRRFYARTILESESIPLYLDGTNIAALPPINKNPGFLQYYYSPQENKWIPM
jgi:hypothetical protein